MLDGTTVVPRVWSQTQCLIDLLFSGTPESTIFHVILPGTSDGFYKFTPWARVNPTILNIACFSQSVLPWSKKEVDPCLHFLGCSISGSKMTSGWVVYILQSGLIAFLIKSSLYWSICFFFGGVESWMLLGCAGRIGDRWRAGEGFLQSHNETRKYGKLHRIISMKMNEH